MELDSVRYARAKLDFMRMRKLAAYYFSALGLYAKLAKIKGPLILWDLQYLSYIIAHDQL